MLYNTVQIPKKIFPWSNRLHLQVYIWVSVRCLATSAVCHFERMPHGDLILAVAHENDIALLRETAFGNGVVDLAFLRYRTGYVGGRRFISYILKTA